MNNWNEFVQHVVDCYPAEACGYVKNNLFYPCENVSTEPHSFALGVADAFAAQYAEYVIHSHTANFATNADARAPSIEDMQAQVAMDKPWAIVYCDGLTVTEPVFFGGYTHRPALLEREFVFNANDCLTLAADYLYEKHGIELPSLPREWDWFDKGQDLIDKFTEHFGFVEVALEDARPSDLFLFKTRTTFINHIGVYLGGNELLHHEFNRLSCIDELARRIKYVSKVVRHRSLL